MFKLIRMHNSTTCVPNIVECQVQSGILIKKGDAYIFTDEGISTNTSDPTRPVYIACENKDPLGADFCGTVKCYQVLPGMEFETLCSIEARPNAAIGLLAELSYANGCSQVDVSTEGQFIISEVFNVEEDGIIRVIAK